MVANAHGVDPDHIAPLIGAARADIEAAKDDIGALDAMPQSLEEAKAAVDRFVANVAEEFGLGQKAGYFTRPGYNGAGLLEREHIAHNGQLRINHAPMLAALIPDLLKKRLHQELAGHYKTLGEGLTHGQRRERKKALEKRLFDLEMEEERLICLAEDYGLDIHRRADCNPVVVLGIMDGNEAP